MKKLLLLGLFLGVVGVGAIYFGIQEDQKQSQAESDHETRLNHVTSVNGYIERLEKATTSQEVQAILFEIDKLPKDMQEEVKSLGKLKGAILSFQEAEEFLNRAWAIQVATAAPRDEPTIDPNNPQITIPPPPAAISPLAKQLFQKSVPLYEASKREIDRLSEVKGKGKYNHLLYYSKGEIYHRYLQLFATEETAKELLAQTVTHYKHALRHKPGDMATVINIELLIKESKGNGGGQGQDQRPQRNRLLSQQAGSARFKGN